MHSAGALAFRRPLALKVRSLVAVRCEGGTCDVFAMMIRRRGPARVERMCLKDTGVVKPGGGRSNLETSSCTHKNLSASAPAGSLSHNTRRVKRRQFKNRNTYIYIYIYMYVPGNEPPIPSPINLSLNSRIKCTSTYPGASQSRAARHAKYTALRYVQGFTARAVRDAVLALPPARTHARRGGSIGSANEERRACHAEPHSPCNPRARGARTGGEKIGRASAGPERWPGRGLPFVLGGARPAGRRRMHARAAAAHPARRGACFTGASPAPPPARHRVISRGEHWKRAGEGWRPSHEEPHFACNQPAGAGRTRRPSKDWTCERGADAAPSPRRARGEGRGRFGGARRRGSAQSGLARMCGAWRSPPSARSTLRSRIRMECGRVMAR